MKKANLPLLLTPLGFILMSVAYYLNRHFQLSDFVTGLFVGAGIGLMILAIMKQRKLMRKRAAH